jgi:hypothetical protein
MLRLGRHRRGARSRDVGHGGEEASDIGGSTVPIDAGNVQGRSRLRNDQFACTFQLTSALRPWRRTSAGFTAATLAQHLYPSHVL